MTGGANCAVSVFRSHLGQTGKGRVQIFPPSDKNVVSRNINSDPHLWHCVGEGSAAKESKRFSTAL